MQCYSHCGLNNGTGYELIIKYMPEITSEIETFLILKYGSVHAAYKIWYHLHPADQCTAFTLLQHDFLCNYEYGMVVDGTGPHKPVGVK